MSRETKEQLARRVSRDNNAAAKVPAGSSYIDPVFGQVTLVGLTDIDAPDDWDIYKVHHSGYDTFWSSAIVARKFGR